MRLRYLGLVLALWTAFAWESSWGQSKQPIPPPSQPAQANQNTKPYEKDTEQSPVIVKILPATESEEKAAADARHEDEKAANDRRLARFTELLFWATGALSVIAFFQLFVFGWQGIQLKRSVSSAKEAYELACEEFTATHRPKIIIHTAEFRHNAVTVKSDEADDNDHISASLLCFNVGESVAAPIEVRAQIYAGDGFTIDVQRPLVKKIERVESGIKFRAEVVSDWRVSELTNVKPRPRDFYCVGWIAYWDENEDRRETGFCFRAVFDIHDTDSARWISANKKEYEYSY